MKILIYLLQKHFKMRAYFLNISEEERKSIQEKQRSIYDGYQTMEPKMAKETPLKVENLALDEMGITVNNKGKVSEYKHTGINKPMKENCKECGEIYEGEVCECGGDMSEGVCNECGNSLGMMDESEDVEMNETNVEGCKTVKEVIKQQGGKMTDLDKDLIKRYNCESINESRVNQY